VAGCVLAPISQSRFEAACLLLLVRPTQQPYLWPLRNGEFFFFYHDAAGARAECMVDRGAWHVVREFSEGRGGRWSQTARAAISPQSASRRQAAAGQSRSHCHTPTFSSPSLMDAVASSGSGAKRVLILGGDGFVGWPTALHLSELGHTACRGVGAGLGEADFLPQPRRRQGLRRPGCAVQRVPTDNRLPLCRAGEHATSYHVVPGAAPPRRGLT
jgi:hypothetical protein